ncbi:DUF2271 domain-containing protein [Massilia cavernae]|uniref:DUF2271 domain-containing protein n=1 Tax=Massilia cavernae TaxID=2320864 RepID=A0A418XG30_9BURK|nr:DUF2271 domain-containing protein [Massilia cavernae]RJG11424.1 DUF2271 domain-containing protein [Massilia cavernae]
MKLQHTLALTLPMLSSWAVGAELAVKFEIPQLNVAEYHRPYVAIWLERADQSVASNLAVLYDVKKKDNGGLKWVKDLRTWWRKAGRELDLPVDGVSGATRATGQQSMTFGPARTQVDKLPAGDYKLVIEAAREAGGRELVRVPLTLPLKPGQSFSASGKEELGAVSVQVSK